MNSKSLHSARVWTIAGGQSDRALQNAEGNSRNYANNSEAWATLGSVQLQLGDFRAAETSLTNAAKFGKVSRDAVFYIRKLKAASGDADGSQKLYETFVIMPGPNYFPTEPAK